MSIILTGETLAAGLRSDMDHAYRQSFDGVLKNLGDVMQMDVPSSRRTELYAARRTMPYPERWERGNPIPTEGTDSYGFSVTNYRFAKAIEWEIDDRKDNQVGDLFSDAQALGRHFASLPTRAFVELLVSSASLLPAIPNAPDGAAAFSATEGGGANRFGISGGNIVTGTGVATSAAIENDFFSACVRFHQFQNSKGQPYFEPNLQSERYVVYFGAANEKVFVQGFAANLVHSVQSSTGAAVSNVILASGAHVTLVPTSRITDNDWFVFRADSPIKAFFHQNREPLQSWPQTEENSDIARKTGREGLHFKARMGFGVNPPFAAIKVNN
jgi:phage major head subunit gpT-like protein